MLILGRKAGQAVQLTLSDLVDPNTPIGEIFHGGDGITIKICRLKQRSVKIGINAPRGLAVLRDELAEGGGKMGQKEMYAAAIRASSEGSKAEAVALLTNLIDTYPDTREADDARAFRYNLQQGTVGSTSSDSSEGIKCQQCGGKMSRTTKADSSLALQLLGVLLFLFGIGLLFVFPIGTLFGIILMLGSLRLGYSKKKIWKCSNCGYFFERA